MIVEYKKLGDSKNCLLTIAIGEPYKTEWENYASFRDYLKLPVSGTSKGLIKPKV